MKRFILCAVLAFLLWSAGQIPAWAVDYIANKTGLWSDVTAWTPNSGAGGPGNGDTVQIPGVTITVDGAAGAGANGQVTVGLSQAINQAGTGTLSCAGGTSLVGTGTHFTTELKPGYRITGGGVTRTIMSITSDTAASLGANTTIAGGSSFTYTPRAVYVSGANGGLTIPAGNRLICRGDLNLSWCTLTLGAGAGIRMDSSLAAGTPIYQLNQSCGELSTYYTTVTVNGTSGSHCIFDIANGSGVGAMGGGDGSVIAGIAMSLTYADFSDWGSASVAAINFVPLAGQSMTVNNCTFTRCGAVTTGAAAFAAATGNISLVRNQWLSVLATDQTILTLNATSATGGATRNVTDNVFAEPTKNTVVNLNGGAAAFTVKRNVIARINETIAGGATNFAGNFFYKRYGSASADWSFVGVGGDTLSDNYFIQDEGPTQANDHQLMTTDGWTGNGGTFRLTNYIFERSAASVGFGMSVFHTVTATVAVADQLDHVLVLPTSGGGAPGHINHRCKPNFTLQVFNCTLLTDPSFQNVNVNDGAVNISNETGSDTSPMTVLRDNIGWSKTVYSGLGTEGFLSAYNNQNPSPLADLVTASGVDHNAVYNASTGTMFDQNGANGTSLLGYDHFRQTTKWTGSTDKNLGTGTNEMTQGPKFKDSSRNLATFDSAYLGNSASAWQDAHSYSVGDMVSTSNAAFYAGATVNFRCVLAHTSAAANSTNGQPGGTTATGYRTCWEFASAYRIRQAIAAGTTRTDAALGLVAADYIATLSAWVRDGFAPTNSALRNADSAGTGTPGAVPGQFASLLFRRGIDHPRAGTRSALLERIIDPIGGLTCVR